MLTDYDDIRSRIKEPPLWFDCNGTPRYDKFAPGLLPDIYAREACLLRIECQACQERFWVGMSSNHRNRGDLSELVRTGFIHYGDPPRHECSGDTMNCEDLKVEEFWKRDSGGEWVRTPELEITLPEVPA